MSFEQMKEIYVTYQDLKTGVNGYLQEAKTITKAVGERIEAENEKQLERTSLLKNRLADPTALQSVKRMAEAELSELEKIELKATQQECEAFEEIMKMAEDMQRDMKKLQKDFREEFESVKAEMASMKSAVLGDEMADRFPVYTESVEKEFNKYRM